MAKKTRPITAAELSAELRANPSFVAYQKARDTELAERNARHHKEQASLLADLRKVGCSVDSVWDLVNTDTSYPRAIPVLLDHLAKPYSATIREGIARAVAVPGARIAWSRLVETYKAEPVDPSRQDGRRVKDALAVAVAGIATPDKHEELLSLVRDRSLGESRVLLLAPLRKSKKGEVRKAIEALAKDPELEREIRSWKR